MKALNLSIADLLGCERIEDYIKAARREELRLHQEEKEIDFRLEMKAIEVTIDLRKGEYE